MLICTVLEDTLDEKLLDYFYNHFKELICQGFNQILLDLTNVEQADGSLAEKLYEIHKMIAVSGGNLNIFGVDRKISTLLSKSDFGYMLNAQENEIVETELACKLYKNPLSIAS